MPSDSGFLYYCCLTKDFELREAWRNAGSDVTEHCRELEILRERARATPRLADSPGQPPGERPGRAAGSPPARQQCSSLRPGVIFGVSNNSRISASHLPGIGRHTMPAVGAAHAENNRQWSRTSTNHVVEHRCGDQPRDRALNARHT